MLVNIELIEDYQKETQASYTDGLTGLYNFGFFRIILDREVKRAERHGEPFTLALIGADSFTFYNKNFGTVKGDRALNLIAGVVNENKAHEAGCIGYITKPIDTRNFLAAIDQYLS